MTRSTFFDNSESNGNASKKIKNRIDAVESTIATHGNVVTRNIASGSFIANTDIYDVAYVNQALIDAAAVADTTMTTALATKQDLITTSTNVSANAIILASATAGSAIIAAHNVQASINNFRLINCKLHHISSNPLTWDMLEVQSTNGGAAFIKANANKAQLYNFKLVNCVDAGLNSISDDRLKHNESPILNALDTINKLSPQKYYQTDEIYPDNHTINFDASDIPDGKWLSGFIAQEVADIQELRHIVNVPDNPETSIYTMNYNSMHAYSIKAIQELLAKNNALEERITALESNG